MAKDSDCPVCGPYFIGQCPHKTCGLLTKTRQNVSNLRTLRPNQPFFAGQWVTIGTGKETYKIKGLGYCGPRETDLGPDGVMVNASEFVQLLIPGGEGMIFQVHKSFLNLVNGGDCEG